MGRPGDVANPPAPHSQREFDVGTTANSLKEGEKVDQFSLGDAEGEDGLSLLCLVLLFSFGAWHKSLSGAKLEDVPQILLQSLTMLLNHLAAL